MPSDEAKSGKTEDDRSLSSLLRARKKNATNAGTLLPKSRPKDAKGKVKDEGSDSPLKSKISPKAAKPKKEEVDDDDDFEILSKNAKSSSAYRPKAVKLKKEEEDSDDEDDRKPISKKSSAKASKESSEKKKKKEDESKNKKGSTATQQNGKKREKKVYDLPGQKRDPPEERDPMRIFYESLHEQIPNSEMAQIWMMESGLLPKELAKKVFERKQKKNQTKLNSPIKTVKKTQSVSAKKKTVSPPVSSIKKKTADSKQTKKRKASSDSDEDDSDDDFVLSKNISAKRQKAS